MNIKRNVVTSIYQFTAYDKKGRIVAFTVAAESLSAASLSARGIAEINGLTDLRFKPKEEK